MNECFVTVEDMMAARDARAQRQRDWLARYGKPLISLTMNIAGPIKMTPLISEGFDEAVKRVVGQLGRHQCGIIAFEESEAFTGPEALWAVDAEAVQIKGLMTAIEESGDFGRLLDIDVISTSGLKVSREAVGLPPRHCLLCQEEATVCGRSRTHSVDALFTRAEDILRETVHGSYADGIAEMAQQALLREVAITPKPGLVDRANNGAHHDMDFFTFVDSATALRTYFRDCVRLGLEGRESRALFRALRYLGMEAEKRMKMAVGNVNTHLGAIFSLGILCGAVGLLKAQDAEQTIDSVCEMCIAMTREELRPEIEAKGGLPGARGEAAEGFPSVRLHGQPAYRKRIAQGDSVNDAGVYALITLMSVALDANVARRGGLARAEALRQQAKALLANYSMDEVRALDALLIHEHISPGGCADLLAVTLFLDYWRS